MESFPSLRWCLGVKSVSPDGTMDIVGMVPAEIGMMILRNLDGPSLVAASAVSDRWRSLVECDRLLARRLGRQLRAEARMRETRALAARHRPRREARAAQGALADRSRRGPATRSNTGIVRVLAAPLGVHKSVKRKISSCVQSVRRRFATDRHVVTSDEPAQPAREAARV